MERHELMEKKWDLVVAIAAVVPVVIAVVRAIFEAKAAEIRYNTHLEEETYVE